MGKEADGNIPLIGLVGDGNDFFPDAGAGEAVEIGKTREEDEKGSVWVGSGFADPVGKTHPVVSGLWADAFVGGCPDDGDFVTAIRNKINANYLIFFPISYTQWQFNFCQNATKVDFAGNGD